ncbi:hypothetical protein Fmac_027518 [Flemingia macrophylla]|uniref:Uncharacterized protein n=1 Tax=Flemingia macrophylla TaxID=520843 RepID=A0ABD1LHZ5_9FABA
MEMNGSGISWRRNLMDMEKIIVEDLIEVISQSHHNPNFDDKWRWMNSDEGVYTVK